MVVVLFVGIWTPGEMFWVILDLWLFKALVALFDTPLFYLGTGLLGNPTIVNPFQPLPSSKVAPRVQDVYPGPDAPDYKNLVVLPQK